ncbi:restriction endonuclease subunit S [Psychrobacter sp. DAB_AL43B]|uniref:restriction endonuclease subunit S n=1 Tax=Psychrobacter sp. DAB_AL43B TaxID=1028416 RepID=UPI0009C34C8A|nr:restriction endonuclease subunit S [Psychrobacter sp. DAB_AL43B]SLJ83764.1 restriction endonuclease S subunit [Psychrobacter sp. DAB_AL43B]
MTEVLTKYQQYAEYKDSGVEWLDVIPMHWVMSKIKYIAPFQVGWTPPTGNDSNFIGENIWANISDLRGKVITDTVKRISDKAAKEASMDITSKGSLLYSFKLSVGSVSFAGCDMYTNEAIASFTSDSLLPLEYLYYVLPKFLIENASTNIYGARILNQELIKNAIILKPTYEEAETIANFLDHETAQIDTLIERQQTLIKLLKEKRQAVISHAVTKGLNPDAIMKDSGVEWLGEVPEHWSVKSYRHASKIYRGKFGHRPRNDPAFYDGEYPFIQTGDVARAGKIITSYSQTLNEKGKSVSQLFPEGTLMMAIAANIGDTAILGFEAYAPDSVIGFKPYTGVGVEFLRYSFLAALPAFEQTSTQSSQANLNIDRVGTVKGAFPSHNEQKEIVIYLDNMLEHYRAIEVKANEQIQLMQERRTAVISAAVTGKIDVRSWEAPDSEAM